MADNPRHADSRVDRVVQLFEHLAPEDLDAMGTLARVYHPQARFKDPFNEVQGLAAITAIFDHMFKSLAAPRFKVMTIVAAGDEAFLTWDFNFHRHGKPASAMTIHGASHLRFDIDGRVLMHRDYWDAAEELYEKLPLIGALMRWLKRRAGS